MSRKGGFKHGSDQRKFRKRNVGSLSEPRWSDESDSKKIKSLKRRLHDLYAKYKGISSSS
jgi:hypothetical protein